MREKRCARLQGLSRERDPRERISDLAQSER